MKTYDDFVTQDLRAAVLRFLLEAEGTANEQVLLRALKETQFPRLTGDKVRAQVDWLRQAGAVSVEWLSETVAVVTLTARGQDCARGDIEVAGVARPERIR